MGRTYTTPGLILLLAFSHILTFWAGTQWGDSRGSRLDYSIETSSFTHAVVPQFVTGHYTRQKLFLTDREYGLALGALVKACSDVLVVSADGSRVLLGKRKVQPQPDWWFIGGRAQPGDTTRAAASRNVHRELSLELPESRFQAIATYSMVWQYRAQEPKESGTADISTVHMLQLKPEEEQRAQLNGKEYSASRFVALEEVLSGNYHPCLKQAVRDLRKQRALASLCAAVESAPPRSAPPSLDAAARSFVVAHMAALPPRESQKVHFEGGTYRDEGG